MDMWSQGLDVHLMKFIKNPGDLMAAGAMHGIFTRNEQFQSAVASRLLLDEGFKTLYENWHEVGKIDVDELLKLPTDSLGHTYASHMKRNQLDPNFLMPIKERSLLSYLWLRGNHVHDLCHVFTNSDVSLLGEIRVKGFELAQYYSPSIAVTVAAGLLGGACQMPDKVESMFTAFLNGYQIGQTYPLVMGIKWELEWSTPLDQLKKKIGVKSSNF